MLDMHPPILKARAPGRAFLSLAASGVTLVGLLGTTIALAAAKPSPGLDANCPATATALVEHFIGADCIDCWKAAPAAPGQPPIPGAEATAATDWSLDWIVPTADDAPMAPGALPEAADRLARLGPHLTARLQVPPAAFDTLSALAPAGRQRKFYVHSSLPHSGYMGVQMHATGAWATGSTAWIALVELLPEGTRDTRIPRHLVRVLVGPLALPQAPGAKNAVAPLYGLRWPENAHADRLMATAWIEAPDGHVVQIASDRCADPK
jgi:hypothetical protein